MFLSAFRNDVMVIVLNHFNICSDTASLIPAVIVKHNGSVNGNGLNGLIQFESCDQGRVHIKVWCEPETGTND